MKAKKNGKSLLKVGKVQIGVHHNSYPLRFYDPMGKQRSISVGRVESPGGLAISQEVARRIDDDLYREKWFGDGQEET